MSGQDKQKITYWWLSNYAMTVYCKVKGLVVIEASPIISVFVNQNFGNLRHWMCKIGGLKVKQIFVDKSKKSTH